jgi:hypothetical protein
VARVSGKFCLGPHAGKDRQRWKCYEHYEVSFLPVFKTRHSILREKEWREKKKVK